MGAGGGGIPGRHIEFSGLEGEARPEVRKFTSGGHKGVQERKMENRKQSLSQASPLREKEAGEGASRSHWAGG